MTKAKKKAEAPPPQKRVSVPQCDEPMYSLSGAADYVGLTEIGFKHHLYVKPKELFRPYTTLIRGNTGAASPDQLWRQSDLDAIVEAGYGRGNSISKKFEGTNGKGNSTDTGTDGAGK